MWSYCISCWSENPLTICVALRRCWYLYTCCKQHQLSYTPATHPQASFSTLSPPPLFFSKETIPCWQSSPKGAWPPMGDPLGGGGVGGRAARETAAGQIALWPRRAIIYCNSGPVRLKEREGEVAWRALALICLSPHPHLSQTMAAWLGGGWWVGGWVLQKILQLQWGISILL